MKRMDDGWYAKVGKTYRGDKKAAPFNSPWEVFNFHRGSDKAVFVRDGKEVLLIEPKSPKKVEPKLI